MRITDLDLLLKQHGIHQLIVIGLISHTCVEAAVELGYQARQRSYCACLAGAAPPQA